MAEIGTTTRLSVGRTTMAANRTLMAWIRTSLSMISFGFTVYKIIQGIQDAVPEIPIDLNPTRAGLVLTGLGIISLTIGIIEYYMVLKEVRKIMPIPYWTHPLWIAAAILIVAVLIFVSILMGAL